MKNKSTNQSNLIENLRTDLKRNEDENKKLKENCESIFKGMIV